MFLVHEERDPSSLIPESLDIDQNDVLSLRPPALEANVKIRLSNNNTLKVLRLNASFGDEPNVPPEWRLYEKENWLDESVFTCNLAVVTLAVVWVAIFVIFAVLIFRGRGNATVSNGVNQSGDEEDKESPAEAPSKHKSNTATGVQGEQGGEDDQINPEGNVTVSGMNLDPKNQDARYGTSSSVNIRNSPEPQQKNVGSLIV